MKQKTYIDHLAEVAERDVAALKRAQESYGDSWKKRGGVGAFMMLARKIDRLEKQVSQTRANKDAVIAPAYDIFQHAIADPRAEGVIDDIRDLRRYLMLVEAELIAMGAECAQTKSRDEQP